ncbi:MAG TPA: redoxin domain-containing protein [bacterium]|jgi:peroxiredoxin
MISYRLSVAVLAAFVGLSCTVQAATLHLPGTPSTMEVRSVFNQKTLFLNLSEVAGRLGVTVKRDTSAGVIVLCSPQACVPVFEQDEAEVQKKDSVLFVRTDEVAAALGCSFNVKKKTDVTLTCNGGLPQGPVGAQVGDMAPGFRLPVDTVSTMSLAERLQQRPLLVVFFRNGDWDPFSKLLLNLLQTHLDSVRALGYDLVAIHGYEAKTAMKWTKDLGLSYPLLSDQYSAVFRAYDVFDRGHFPLPSVFAIDRSGHIRMRYMFDLSAAPDMSAILQTLKR